jgi:hypothetical protein
MLTRRKTMSTTAVELSNPLPTAKQAKEMVALAEAEMASEALRQKKKADAEKKTLTDQLSKPSGISEEEACGSGRHAYGAWRDRYWRGYGVYVSGSGGSSYGYASADDRCRYTVHISSRRAYRRVVVCD